MFSMKMVEVRNYAIWIALFPTLVWSMCFVKTVIFTMWHQIMNKCHKLMMDRKDRRQMEWQEWLTDEHWWRREDMREARHVPVHQCSEEMKNMT